MNHSLRVRLVVIGLLLVAAGIVLIVASGREGAQVITLAPGVHVASPAQPGGGWDLLLDESAGGGSGPADGVIHAERVTQHGTLPDGRVIVEGQVNGMPTFVLVRPADAEPADVEAEFPSRGSLEEFLERDSLRMPAMSPVAMRPAERNAGLLWGGIASIGAGLVAGVLTLIPGRSAPSAAAGSRPTRRNMSRP